MGFIITVNHTPTDENIQGLIQDIRLWGKELGFQQVGFADTDLQEHEQHLEKWVKNGFAGEMNYMWRHGEKRSRPADLVPGTISVISVRMDYLATITS
jgi:epoxyqueuosine reductase